MIPMQFTITKPAHLLKLTLTDEAIVCQIVDKANGLPIATYQLNEPSPWSRTVNPDRNVIRRQSRTINPDTSMPMWNFMVYMPTDNRQYCMVIHHYLPNLGASAMYQHEILFQFTWRPTKTHQVRLDNLFRHSQ